MSIFKNFTTSIQHDIDIRTHTHPQIRFRNIPAANLHFDRAFRSTKRPAVTQIYARELRPFEFGVVFVLLVAAVLCVLYAISEIAEKSWARSHVV